MYFITIGIMIFNGIKISLDFPQFAYEILNYNFNSLLIITRIPALRANQF